MRELRVAADTDDEEDFAEHVLAVDLLGRLAVLRGALVADSPRESATRTLMFNQVAGFFG
jgi:hypothetical protein